MGDGQSLANTVGDLATSVTHRDLHPQELPGKLRELSERVPAGSRAERVLRNLATEVDHPMTPAPQLPAGTPAPLRTLADELHAIPMCRRDPKEMDIVVQVAQAYAGRERQNGGIIASKLHDVTQQHHESTGDTGHQHIIEAVRKARKELETRRNWAE